MSSNHAQCTVRFLNSIRHHGLNIERICTTAGRPVTGYLNAYSTNLYLSADGDKELHGFYNLWKVMLIICSGFSTIFHFLERILMEDIR